MGSWNETCGLTRLPIHSGDPVVLIMLSQVTDSGGADGACYASHYWKPYALPLRAVYNDYGGIEDVGTEWNQRWILGNTRESMESMPEGENPYHEPAVDPEQLDSMDTLMEWIRSDRVWVRGARNPRGGGHLLDWTMCHAWAWDYLAQQSEHWGDVTTLEMNYKRGQERYRSLFKLAQDHPDGINFEMAYWRWRDTHSLRDHWTALLTGGSSFESYGGATTGIRSYADLMRLWAVAGRDVDHPEVDDFLREMSAFLLVTDNMSRLRMTWHPQTGKGSQCAEYPLYKSFFLRCQQHVDRMLNGGDDDDCDTDDTV
jgi:hypothetical protein